MSITERYDNRRWKENALDAAQRYIDSEDFDIGKLLAAVCWLEGIDYNGTAEDHLAGYIRDARGHIESFRRIEEAEEQADAEDFMAEQDYFRRVA